MAVGVVFFYDYFMFLMVMVLGSFYFMTDYSWTGMFIFSDSFMGVIMAVLGIFSIVLVFLVEESVALVYLSQILVYFCVLFFYSSNFIMLYIFYELCMFPILVMILGYGSQVEKVGAGYYLLLYTVLCSFPFLFIILNMGLLFSSAYSSLFVSWEVVIFLSLCFLVKFPVYFLHLWLPKAHVEAPTVASMILAGLLLKLGCVGFVRVLDSVSYYQSYLMFLLSFLGMLLCSLSCAFQSDVKSLAAYSSVVHMGLYLVMVMSFSSVAKSSGFLVLLSHGFSSMLLFFLIGMFYHYSGTRLIYYFSGLMSSLSFYAYGIMLVMMSNTGVPPFWSFFGEFLAVGSLVFGFVLSFVIVLVYLFVSFYYSIYFIKLSMSGQGYFNTKFYTMGYGLVLIFMVFNVFWLGLF
uniref:NADH-ubiquinone oxidoreductase chain 4 n=1 Tax=Philometroides sanguineus TaxID=378106 RepID=A0A0U1X9Y8_9BILA|nr:NADH dehydrogenase subunit 4 [Philometroides sanguineus]AIN37105.1 NADH dehydrogenase subunit 4 [Philometroides sanguineus]